MDFLKERHILQDSSSKLPSKPSRTPLGDATNRNSKTTDPKPSAKKEIISSLTKQTPPPPPTKIPVTTTIKKGKSDVLPAEEILSDLDMLLEEIRSPVSPKTATKSTSRVIREDAGNTNVLVEVEWDENGFPVATAPVIKPSSQLFSSTTESQLKARVAKLEGALAAALEENKQVSFDNLLVSLHIYLFIVTSDHSRIVVKEVAIILISVNKLVALFLQA